MLLPIHIYFLSLSGLTHLSKFYNNEKLISFLFFLVISRLFQNMQAIAKIIPCIHIIQFFK